MKCLLVTIVFAVTFSSFSGKSMCSKLEALIKADQTFKKKTSRSNLHATQKSIDEHDNYFTVTYSDSLAISSPLRKGASGGYIKVSKCRCKLLDVKILQ